MLLLLLIILLSLYVIFADDKKEHFGYIMPWPTRITRPTRNMSYDLRGEAYYPPLLNLPFDNTSIRPIQHPELVERNGICV